MPIEEEQSTKQLKSNTQTSIHLDHKTFVPLKILSFNGLDLSNNPHQYYKNKHTAGYPGDVNSSSPVFKYSKDSTHAHEELDEIIYEHCWNKKNTSTVKHAPQMRQHLIAERMRRENLSQLFVALSTMVPGLKKVIF